MSIFTFCRLYWMVLSAFSGVSCSQEDGGELFMCGSDCSSGNLGSYENQTQNHVWNKGRPNPD